MVKVPSEGLDTILDETVRVSLPDTRYELDLETMKDDVTEAVDLPKDKMFAELSAAVEVSDDRETEPTNQRSHEALSEIRFVLPFIQLRWNWQVCPWTDGHGQAASGCVVALPPDLLVICRQSLTTPLDLGDDPFHG